MFRLLQLLLPFVSDVFFKNEELKSHLKSPGFLFQFVIGSVIIFCAGSFIYDQFARQMFRAHEHARTSNQDYRELDTIFRATLKERNEKMRELRLIRKERDELVEEISEQNSIIETQERIINKSKEQFQTVKEKVKTKCEDVTVTFNMDKMIEDIRKN